MLGTLVALAAGLAAGVLSGLFGIGGALLTTPIVRLALGRPELIAVGTPLAVVVPTAIVGALAHVRAGTADVRGGLVIGVAAAPFAVLGALGSAQAGGRPVLLLTSGLLVVLAVGMLRRDRGSLGLQREDHPGRLLATGVAAGTAAGFLGLGGGFVIVPSLARWVRMPVIRAVGTSLVAIAVLSVPGAATHAVLGHVEWGLAASLAVGVIPGVLLGARLAGRLRKRALEIAFGCVLLVAAILLALDVLG